MEKDDALIQEIKKITTCAICQKVFENPVSLRCGHTFCNSCINTSAKTRRKNCPQCKAQLSTGCSTGKINLFPPSYVLREIIQLISSYDNKEKTVEKIVEEEKRTEEDWHELHNIYRKTISFQKKKLDQTRNESKEVISRLITATPLCVQIDEFFEKNEDNFYSTVDLCGIFKCSRGALSKAMNKLEQKIYTKRIPNKKGGFSCFYKKNRPSK